MLLVTIKALGTITKNSEVTANPIPVTHTDVWEWTVITVAASIISKMYTERRALRRWVMRQLAVVGVVRTVALQEGPTDSNLRRIMLIHACQATTAGT